MNPEISPIENLKPTQNSRGAFKSVIREIFIFALIAFGVVLPFRIYIAEPYIVDGASMDPTFATGNYLIIDKISYKLSGLDRNSVVVFKYPNDPSKNFIKRIIGLPGDIITVKDNVTRIVNSNSPKGFNLDQSYVAHECQSSSGKCISSFQKILGPDEYFVMGDNRVESFDSRSWGPVPANNILGKPILRLWPLDKIGVLPGQDSG